MDYPFGMMKSSVSRAERYRKVAAEYSELAEGTYSPMLRAYYERIAQQYREHANGELRAAEHDTIGTRVSAASQS